MVASEYEQMYDNMRDNVLSSQFDTSEFLSNLSHILSGLTHDPKSGHWVIRQEYAYLNELGATQILNEIKGRIQNVNASGNLRRKEIAMIREDIWNAISQKLCVNYEEYELKAENTLNILYIVDHNLLTFLSRSEEGSFFKKFSDFFSRKETVSNSYQIEQEQEKKRRFSL